MKARFVFDHSQPGTFKVRLRDRFKYWLRWKVKWWLRVAAGKARGLIHGRMRCIVLGHDHSLPDLTGREYWCVEDHRQERTQFIRDLNAGVDITEFIEGERFAPGEETPQAFYLDDSVLDDAFDDIHGEWPGDLKYWRWDEGQGGSDAAT